MVISAHHLYDTKPQEDINLNCMLLWKNKHYKLTEQVVSKCFTARV